MAQNFEQLISFVTLAELKRDGDSVPLLCGSGRVAEGEPLVALQVPAPTAAAPFHLAAASAVSVTGRPPGSSRNHINTTSALSQLRVFHINATLVSDARFICLNLVVSTELRKFIHTWF